MSCPPFRGAQCSCGHVLFTCVHTELDAEAGVIYHDFSITSARVQVGAPLQLLALRL